MLLTLPGFEELRRKRRSLPDDKPDTDQPLQTLHKALDAFADGEELENP